MPITRAYTKAGSPLQGLANPVINGAFDIWQRGTAPSYAGGVVYTADRWQMYSENTNRTVSRQTVSDTTNLPNIQYAARLQRTAGNTATNNLVFATSFETVNSIPFAGKPVTLSFYARAGANYSGASSQITVSLGTGTGTDQNYLVSGYTGQSDPIYLQNATLTTTWQRFAFTGTVPSNTTEMAVRFATAAFSASAAGANDWVEITGVQVDIGTYTAATAPEFRRAGGTIAGELAACQRYYYRFPNGDYAGTGLNYSTTRADVILWLPVPMRGTVSWSAPTGTYRLGLAGTTTTQSTVSAFYSNSSPRTINASFQSLSGLTAGQANNLYPDAAGSYIEASAEL